MSDSLLDQLAPAHAPPPPGLWPPAPGWWMLAALWLGITVLLLLWLRNPNRKLRHAAMRELKQLEKSGKDDFELARGLEHLLRRYALARFGHEPIARLSGDPWLAFVASHGGADLNGDAGRELLRAAYGGKATPSRARWLSGARGFLGSRK